MTELKEKTRDLHAIATEIQAIAQIGLAYSKDPFDLERYQQLMRIAAELFSPLCDLNSEHLSVEFLTEIGYSCPKIDVRAFIRKDDQLLLVREAQDNKWSLPGGWADVNLSPSECVAKEVLEETGLICQVNRLLALWDTAKHDHPPHWPYIYKCIFDCSIMGGEFSVSHEISDVRFFPLDDLPPLSRYRITVSQIEKLVDLQSDGTLCTVYD
ncbi:Mutator MutT protein [Legionella quinlivanii]|uniref:Mutator MutT protein n=1 Tax=Legionella quinlivanii TaxID=45073 RepID=A0A0W0XTU7_9GAMM|nr:NUDIX hydrolase [Legionella quinlivanii]KTD47989.1 Mutator MutT protein [Legionella quinlivanii]MCW8450730.1 NUDIX hydrolase [Legionella quinlivanii]SEG20727.1 ADP-ribose pyrophosphatase YjhB, NUDIX family [Legionella quinlivanii DSM 21216]STY11101.1 Mutator MutT protein [Legionella quinlivanii]